MAFTGITRKGGDSSFQGSIIPAGLQPRALFQDNNKDAISGNPATLEFMLPALDAADRLFRSLKGRHTPSHGQIARQCKL